MVDIFEADISGNTAANLRALFAGEVSDCTTEGPFLSVTAKSLSSVFDRPVPRRLYQIGCNWNLFEAGCGVSAGSWQWEATVVSYDQESLMLTTNAVYWGSSPATPEDHLFAGGYLTIGDQTRLIADSQMVTGNLVLTIAAPFVTAPNVGDRFNVWPGCPGDYQTCAWRFHNASRFGGFPFIPVGNPTIVNVSQTSSGSAKK
jgi:hypothetical protein